MIEELPPELWVLILSYVPPFQVLRDCRRVSRYFRGVSILSIEGRRLDLTPYRDLYRRINPETLGSVSFSGDELSLDIERHAGWLSLKSFPEIEL